MVVSLLIGAVVTGALKVLAFPAMSLMEFNLMVFSVGILAEVNSLREAIGKEISVTVIKTTAAEMAEEIAKREGTDAGK